MLLKGDNRAELAPAVLMVAHQAGFAVGLDPPGRAVPEDSNPLRDAPSIRSRTGSRRAASPSTRRCCSPHRQESGLKRGRKAGGRGGLDQLMRRRPRRWRPTS